MQTFKRNFESAMQALDNGKGEIEISDGCSSTGIFGFFLQGVISACTDIVGTSHRKIHHVMSCESDKAKQSFLLNHHPDMDLILPDICMLQNPCVYDLRDPHTPVVPPCTAVFGSGYSCKDLSKANSQRKSKKTNLRDGKGTSGTTLAATLDHFRLRRPTVGFLENVPEMLQNSSWNEDECQFESESDWVVSEFKAMDYVTFPVCIDALEYRSPMARVRWWLAVLDVEPSYAATHDIQTEVLQLLKGAVTAEEEAFDVNSFFLDGDILDKMLESFPYQHKKKQHREEEGWKQNHYTYCTLHELDWPRDLRSNYKYFC